MKKTGADFARGQEVTVGRYGPKVMVIDIDEDLVTCWDTKSAKESRHHASNLYRL